MYPIALSLRGKRAVVVGGGNVAERKIRGLLAAGAQIVVVSPALTDALASLAGADAIRWIARGYAAGDLAGATLAFAATSDEATNASVVAEARAAGILVNDASDAERGDFATPAVHRSGPLTVTVDSAGLSPSFTKRIRDELALQFDARYARAAATLGALRERVQTVVPEAMRGPVMRHFAERDVDELAAMPAGAVEHEVERTADTLAGVVPAQARPLVCASRASALAMTQTRAMMAKLAAGGIPSTVLNVTTRGDAVQDRSIAAIGTDNVFVKELELALRERRADYAVHSCKDLPSTLAEDMALAAITAREDARDAYCSERFPAFADLPPGARVGTSSPRRRAQLRALRPDLEYDDIRGNVDTRLRKLREGQYDAIVLACAGLNRLGVRATYTVPFAVDAVTPAVAQGRWASRPGPATASRPGWSRCSATRRRRSPCGRSARSCARSAAAAKPPSAATRRGATAPSASSGRSLRPTGARSCARAATPRSACATSPQQNAWPSSWHVSSSTGAARRCWPERPPGRSTAASSCCRAPRSGPRGSRPPCATPGRTSSRPATPRARRTRLAGGCQARSSFRLRAP